ncbi:hypothetical protein ACJZ2D_013479 [Fusarium nematophilum]
MGAAVMYNHTGWAPAWKTRVQGLIDLFLLVFFTVGGYFRESACEDGRDSCPSFVMIYETLSYRWISVTAQLAPFTAASILSQLRQSAEEDHMNSEDENFAAMGKAMARLTVVSSSLDR